MCLLRRLSLVFGILVATLSVGCVKDRVRPYVNIGQERGLRLVRFNFYAPSAREVYLAGSFNDWIVPRYEDEEFNDSLGRPFKMEQSQDYWTVVAAIPPGVHYYSYYVDRMYWRIDEASHEKTQTLAGEWRNIVVVQ